MGYWMGRERLYCGHDGGRQKRGLAVRAFLKIIVARGGVIVFGIEEGWWWVGSLNGVRLQLVRFGW